MPLALATLRAGVRAWVEAAINDATILVIDAQGSGPRPNVPFVTIELLGIDSPEWDDPQPIRRDTITALNQVARTFSVAGDLRIYYPAGGFVQAADSTGNDGTYTVASIVFAAGVTTITVTTAIPSAVADGHLTGSCAVFGTRLLDWQVDVIGPGAMERAERIRAALGLMAPLAALRTAGLAHYASEAIQDLTDLVDTKREERAAFTVRLAADSVTPEWVGILERAQIQQTTERPDGTTFRSETVTVDIDDQPYAP